jgi:hypothetical protein
VCNESTPQAYLIADLPTGQSLYRIVQHSLKMPDYWQSTAFPNEPIFKMLLEAAQENRHDAVSDSIRGVNASYSQLLVDICTMREEIRKLIPHSMFDARGLMPLEATCIFILGPASYLFILASFTALSLGGAICPLGRCNKEELYY